MLDACHARGLTPMVTYNHFTVPRWFAARGGFEAADAADLFANFADKATARLGDLISYATTFNEANIQRLLGQLHPWPGGQGLYRRHARRLRQGGGDSDRFSSLLFAPVETSEATCWTPTPRRLHAMKAGPGDFPVGLTLTMQDIQGVARAATSSPRR